MASSSGTDAQRRSLRWSAALLIGGFVLNAAVTMLFHPSGDEDNHEVIFTRYAHSASWEWVHLAQFVGVLLALAGLLLLYPVLRPRSHNLALCAAGLTIATAAGWSVLQAVDGIALKQAVDAWTDATGAERAIRLADAETVRWTEWGVQSYVRVAFGLALLVYGAAILVARAFSGWTGWVAVLAGALSTAWGVDVGYSGLESSFQQIASPVFNATVAAFAVGVAVASRGVGDRTRVAR
ncbi:DUF4386 family protein [Georgenia sp. SUBG003]|uniref:DUF4386 family protein n=1 Tax=Georgenia sp. SUBG003 TaxID=1497974 RepID=UPI000AE09A83